MTSPRLAKFLLAVPLLVFSLPLTGAPNLLVSGIGTNSFTWGLGVGSPPSSLEFCWPKP